MKYYLLCLMMTIGFKSFSQTSRDTVKIEMVIYSKAVSGFDSLAHIRYADTLNRRLERGWVIQLHGVKYKLGDLVSTETYGYLWLNKKPMYKHVAKAVYFNW